MARCPDCNRFVSYGEMEVEDLDVEVESYDLASGQGSLQVDFTVYLTCGECGTHLKENAFSEQIDFEHACEGFANDDEIEVEDSSAEGSERRESLNAKGEPIPFRYQRQFYGAEVTISIKCPHCEETIEITKTLEAQASSFDEV